MTGMSIRSTQFKINFYRTELIFTQNYTRILRSSFPLFPGFVVFVPIKIFKSESLAVTQERWFGYSDEVKSLS